MISTNLPPSRLLLLLAICVSAASIRGQEAPPAVTSVPPSLADFEKADRSVVESLRKIERTLRDEVAAGRLKQTEATADEFHVQFLLGIAEQENNGAVDFHARGGGRNRSGNTAVAAAWDGFDSAREVRRTLVHEQLPVLVAGQLREAANSWRIARRGADLTPAISALHALHDLVERLPGKIEGDREQLSGAVEFLHKSKELLVAQESENAVLIGNAVREMKESSPSALGDFLSAKETVERRKTVIASLRTRGEAAFRECLETLPVATRASDLDPIIAKLHEAADAEEALTQRQSGEWIDRFEKAEKVGRQWQSLLATEAGGYWLDAGGMARELVSAARELSPALAIELTRKAKASERRGNEEDRQAAAVLFAKIEKIANAADARSLASEVRTSLEDRAGEKRELAALAQDLERLSQGSALSNGGRSIPAPADYFTPGQPWTAQMMSAAERIRRNAIAVWYDRPELLAGPLQSRPIEEALDQLVTAAVALENWREAYDLLNIRAVVAPNFPPTGEAITLRMFLVAQNFERAELFEMAANMYSKVLQNPGPNVPSAEAAERLKQLTREHPQTRKLPSP